VATREVFAEQDYARGVGEFSAPLELVENAIGVLVDRSGLASLSSDTALHVEVWYEPEAGAAYRRLSSSVIPGGEAVGRDGVEPYSRVDGRRIPGTGKYRLRVVAEKACRCAVIVEDQRVADAKPKEPRRSVAFAQANSVALTSVTGHTETFLIDADADRVLVSCLGIDRNEGALGTVTHIKWDGTELTKISTSALYPHDGSFPGNAYGQDVRRLVAPVSGTKDLVWTHGSGGTAHRIFFGWIVLHGVDQTTPDGTVQEADAQSGTTASRDCTGVTDGMSIGFCFWGRDGTATITPGGGQTQRTEKESIGGKACGSIDTIAGSGTNSFSWTLGATASSWGVFCVPFNPAPPSFSLEQEGSRFRADDGDEDAATWLAAQDTDITRAKDTNTRLRLLIDATGDPPARKIKYQSQKVGDDVWKDVD
jgi:hypothetical protein